MIEIKRLGAADIRDANLPNDPFPIRGRLIPALENGAWSWRTELFPGQTEMCFPDFPYDPADESAVFLGAYEHGVCVGLAVLRKAMFRYLYLDDLKVCRAWRGRGVGARLVEACMDTAKEMGLQGVYVVAQDNNLDACLFYLRRGFAIGGFDNRAYRGTPQAHKADVYFYRDCEQQPPPDDDKQKGKRRDASPFSFLFCLAAFRARRRERKPDPFDADQLSPLAIVSAACLAQVRQRPWLLPLKSSG